MADGHGGDVGCAESIVNVYDTDVRRARVEHAQQSGDPTECGAVAYAGRNSDDRSSYQASNDAGKRTFHSSADDNDAGTRKDVGLGEDAVQASDANVDDAIDCKTKILGSNRGFLCDRQVTGSGADDSDTPGRGLRISSGKADDPRHLMIFGPRHEFADGGKGIRIGACSYHAAAGFRHAGEDSSDLLGRLASCINDFGKAETQTAVVVNFGEAGVLKGQPRKLGEGLCRGGFTALDALEELKDGVPGHARARGENWLFNAEGSIIAPFDRNSLNASGANPNFDGWPRAS